MTTESKIKKFNWSTLLLIFSALLLLCLFLVIRHNRIQAEKLELNEKLIDNLVGESTKIIELNGERLIRTEVLEAENIEVMRQLQGKDAQINRLVELTEQYSKQLAKGGLVMTASTDGNIVGKAPTKVELPNNNNNNNNNDSAPTKVIYPTYSAHRDFDGWASISSIANKDSTSYSLTYRDSIDVVVFKETKGLLWWKKTKYYADLNSRNPFNSESSYRVAEIKVPSNKDRFSLGLGATTGFTQLNGSYGLGWTIGLNLGYKLTSF